MLCCYGIPLNGDILYHVVTCTLLTLLLHQGILFRNVKVVVLSYHGNLSEF